MTCYVDPKTGRGTKDGHTPDTAFQSVQHAVGVATSGDTIMIAPGAYNQDLPKIISEAQASHINVAVTGSDEAPLIPEAERRAASPIARRCTHPRRPGRAFPQPPAYR